MGLLRINYRFNAWGRVLGQAPGMKIIVEFKRTMISVASMLTLGLGLCLSTTIGTGAAQAQFRAAVFTPPVAAGSTLSTAGVPGSVCDVSALPPFNATGPWFFSLCPGGADGQPEEPQNQVVRQTCFFTATATARLHLSPPMLRRALLRALEAVSASGAATPDAVGVFSMQCLRGEQSPAG